jgi:nucleoside-diphosphate-sugar epimerase
VNILVTGASGFVGAYLCNQLVNDGHRVRASSRTKFSCTSKKIEHIQCGDLSEYFDWSEALTEIDVVIHLAARVHQMDCESSRYSDAYFRLNLGATQNLAMQSKSAGVKRFIFLSTAKVNGEWTLDGQMFSSSDKPNPQGAYAMSKLSAENELRKISSEGAMDFVIIRPPLIYGPRVGGNFLKLLKIVDKYKILPLGGASNFRSILFVGNLTDFISRCLSNSDAGNKIFMVADESPIKFSKLIFDLSMAFKKQIHLIAVPIICWRVILTLLKKESQFNRLFKSFVLDNKNSVNTIGWKPRYSTQEGLVITVNDYLRNYEANY